MPISAKLLWYHYTPTPGKRSWPASMDVVYNRCVKMYKSMGINPDIIVRPSQFKHQYSAYGGFLNTNLHTLLKPFLLKNRDKYPQMKDPDN